jgi:replication initiation and membrane attachment protein
VFRADGTLDIDFLQHKANLDYLQGRRREEQRTLSLARAQEAKMNGGAVGGAGASGVPEADKQEHNVEMAYYLEVPELLQNKCDVHQYNFVLRNEPYTEVVKYYFTGGIVPTGVLDMLGVLNLAYKLNEEVLNVLLHYTHVTRRSWSRSSLEQAASDMLGRQIATYEQAVQFVRERLKLKLKLEAKEKAAENGAAVTRGGGSRTAAAAGRGRSSGGAGGSGAAGTARAKPHIPVAQPAEGGAAVSPERLEEIRRKAKKLDEVFNNRKA